MSSSAIAPFSLVPGASWLTKEGQILPVTSFHEEWMREHPELTGGSRNVCELILKTGWISVALFKGGYVELMIPSRRDRESRRLVRELLSRNGRLWTKALVMSMDEEGYVMIEPGDTADQSSLDRRMEATL